MPRIVSSLSMLEKGEPKGARCLWYFSLGGISGPKLCKDLACFWPNTKTIDNRTSELEGPQSLVESQLFRP